MKTLRVRVKDKHSKVLEAMALECNLVWNYVNELSYKHLLRTGKFFSNYEIHKYTAGATKEGLTIHSQTVQAITDEYVAKRKYFGKAKLRWRSSRGPRKSLGWIPFKVGAVSYTKGQLRYTGKFFSLWDSYGLSNYSFKAGCFSQDAKGCWYANLCVETRQHNSTNSTSVGIDLGLKEFATLSTGEKVEAQRIYRKAEADLSLAQRANKKDRVRAIHAKIKNCRNDFLHKLSTRIVKEYGAIFVGDVSASKLAKTKMAKSVFDASWSSFKTMLQYKSHEAGVLCSKK